MLKNKNKLNEIDELEKGDYYNYDWEEYNYDLPLVSFIKLIYNYIFNN